jgi:hypothetical protein
MDAGAPSPPPPHSCWAIFQILLDKLRASSRATHGFLSMASLKRLDLLDQPAPAVKKGTKGQPLILVSRFSELEPTIRSEVLHQTDKQTLFKAPNQVVDSAAQGTTFKKGNQVCVDSPDLQTNLKEADQVIFSQPSVDTIFKSVQTAIEKRDQDFNLEPLILEDVTPETFDQLQSVDRRGAPKEDLLAFWKNFK